jgi:prepilin-type N-terminal cleavage/methylation domain-containing protein
MSKKRTQLGRRTTRDSGFSLVELLIVVSVILIIAAIAIPNFIRSKMRANESGAVANLRNITTANVAYLTTYGIGYASGLPKLSGNNVIVDANAAGLIDEVLAAGNKSGYSYGYSVATVDSQGHVVAYTLTAEPLNFGTTGEKYFYTDQTAIIRFNTAAPATVTDPAI